jgi:hypothetical protein
MDGPAEHPELWAFLDSLHYSAILSGTVAAIERFGVFVALDVGPDHPFYPNVGFIRVPSWIPPASAEGGNERPRSGTGEAGPPPRRYGGSVDDHPGDGSQGWLLLCDL